MFHDSFGIGARKIDAVQLSLQDAVCNVSSVNAYFKNTVAEVRQHYKMKETAATNGPKGTFSGKTQESLVLLERGMEQLRDNVKNVNKDDIDMRTLLTTQVKTFMQSPTSKTRLSLLFSMLKTLKQFQRNL